MFDVLGIHTPPIPGNGQLSPFQTDVPVERVAEYDPPLQKVHPDARDFVSNIFLHTTLRCAPGRIMTDEYNPVDFYDAGNREQIRKFAVEQIMK